MKSLLSIYQSLIDLINKVLSPNKDKAGSLQPVLVPIPVRRFVCMALACVLFATSTSAQTPGKVSYHAVVQDSAGSPLVFATAMLLNPKDSSLLSYAHTDDKGAFDFSRVSNIPYILNITYMGYTPMYKLLPVASNDKVDLGVLTGKPISVDLYEVVIKTAKAPLSFKGDTVEYNVSSFKVPPGASVEDLLRRLPGIEVDADGSIKAQGKAVNKVYVDGKTFFGSDPKAATRGLDASVLSKVKVYNDKTEQAKLTGVDDGKKEKVLDLQLKEEFKKGRFGKLSAGGGTSDRYRGNGNINFFNPSNQLSFIAYGNNINESGIDWKDYQEFKGGNGFTRDPESFGFINTSNRNTFYTSVPIGFNGGAGYSKNGGVGTNYNYFTKKTNLNVGYFYNATDLVQNTYSTKKTYYGDSYYRNVDTVYNHNTTSSHSASVRLEEKFDSLKTMIVKGEFSANIVHNPLTTASLYQDNNSVTQNQILNKNYTGEDRYRGNAFVYYSHQFKKKGPVLAVNGGFVYNSSKNDNGLDATNQFFTVPSTTLTKQATAISYESKEYRTGVMYNQPLSSSFNTNVFYNYMFSDQDNDRQVTDQITQSNLAQYSKFYNYKQLTQTSGLAFHYFKEGVNIMVGGGVQHLNYKGLFAQDKTMAGIVDTFNTHFLFFVPKTEINIELDGGKSLNFEYGYQADAPSYSQLAPVTIVNSANFKTTGNPNLRPTTAHNFSFDFNSYSSSTLSYYGIDINTSFYNEQISQSQTVSYDSLHGYSISQTPINVKGGSNISSSIWTNFPIIKTVLNMGPSASFNYTSKPTLVNGVLNQTDLFTYSAHLSLQYILTDRIIMSGDVNGSLNKAYYDIQRDLNQTSYNVSCRLTYQWLIASKWFFNATYNYKYFNNDKLSFHQNQHIVNAGIKRLLGSKNQFELSLSAFDIFNNIQSIQQNAADNYVYTSQTPTLSRYFMVGLSYNMRGHEDKLKKNRWN